MPISTTPYWDPVIVTIHAHFSLPIASLTFRPRLSKVKRAPFTYIQASCQGGYVHAYLIQHIDVAMNIENQKMTEGSGLTRNSGHIWQLVTYDHSPPSMRKGIFKEAALAEKMKWHG